MSKQSKDVLEDFARETTDDLLKRLSVEQRLRGLPAEALLTGLSAPERLKGLSSEQRLDGLSAEEVIKALPVETREALARQLEADRPSSEPRHPSSSASRTSGSAAANSTPAPTSKFRSFLNYSLFMAYRRDLDHTDLLEHQLDEWILLSILEILQQLSPEERMKGLPAEARVNRLSSTQRLQGLSSQQRLEGLSAKEIIEAFPPVAREALTSQLNVNGSSPMVQVEGHSTIS